MNEITKIVFERNKERKLLTIDDIKKICFIILKKKKYSFVNNVEVFNYNPNESSCAGVYYRENIFFFFQQILNLIQENVEDFSNFYEIDGASVDIYNYFFLNIIFHELAHVRQHAIINDKRSSIEKKIFSMFLSLSSNRDFYNKNYCDILTEVNANNYSVVTTNAIYDKLPKNFITQNDWQLYQLFTLKTLLFDNYEIIQKRDDILSPAERIIDKFDDEIFSSLNTNLDECVKLIYNTDNLSIYKKLMLGLPITYLEYAYSNLISSRINSNEEINAVKKLQKKFN